MKPCIHCKTPLPDEAVFCYQCGTQQIPAAETPAEKSVSKCPHCGTPISQPGQAFCDACGYPLLPKKERTIAPTPVPAPADQAVPGADKTVKAPEPEIKASKSAEKPINKTKKRKLPVRKIGWVLAGVIVLALLGIGGRYILQKLPSGETRGAEIDACQPAEITEDYESANQKDLEGDLRHDSYFKAGEEYSIAENATFKIPAGRTLIIQPGVRVRFGEGSRFVVEGTLLACGRSSRRILFTANTEAGLPGFWKGIEFNGAEAGTQLGYATVEFAGRDKHAAIWVKGSNIQLEDINFDSNQWYPISLDPNSEPKLRGTFDVENGGSDWEVRGGDLTGTRLWNFNPSIVVNGIVKIIEDARLNIPENSVIKFLPQSAFDVYGELIALGTSNQKIILTSVNDGGEEGAPKPKAGDWVGVGLRGQKGNSKLVNVEIRYAGGQAPDGRTYACLYLDDSSPTLESVSVQSCGTFSLSSDIRSAPQIKDFSLDSKDLLKRWELRGSTLEEVGTHTLASTETTDGTRLDPLATGWLGVAQKATLIIDPGTQLLFANGGNSGLWADGVLKINGTSQKPVLMTSWHDPQTGGTGQPSAGDWGGLHINKGVAGETVVQNLTIRYAGATENTCLRLLGSSARLENVSIDHCAGYPMSSDASAQPILKNLALTDNTLGNIWEIRQSDLAERSTWTWALVTLADDQPLIRRINGKIRIAEEATLALAPGLTLAFGNYGYLDVQGGIQAKGTPDKPILLTSWRDSQINANEGGAQPGDWLGVILESEREGQVIENVKIHYAGNTGQQISCLHLINASPTVNNIEIDYCSYYPISSDLNSNPISGNITLTNNQMGNAWVLRVSTLSTGNTQKLQVIQQVGGEEDMTRLVTGQLTIDADAKLEIGTGVVLRFTQGAGISVKGSMSVIGSEKEHVVMTSWRDPEYSKEGGVQAGDWSGLYIEAPQGDVKLDWIEIRYAGGGEGAITLNKANPNLAHLTIKDSASYPISMDIQSDPHLDQVTLLGNIPANAIEMRGSTLDSAEQTWGPLNQANGELVRVVTGMIIIGENATLTVDSPSAIKFTEESGVDVYGGLLAKNTVFTSFHDDDYGGNTDGTTGGENFWNGISLLTQKSVKLQNFTLRYAVTGISMKNASPDLSSVTIGDCKDAALSADPSSAPAFENVTLKDNTINGMVLLATELPDGETHWVRLGGNNDQVVRILRENLTVPQGAQLLIDEGVVIKFGLQVGLIVEGKLSVSGTEQSPVIFTTLSDDEAGGNTDKPKTTPSRGDWVGLVVNPNNTSEVGLSLTYTEIRYAANGISLVNMPVWTYDHLIISDSQDFGIKCDELSAFTVQNDNIQFIRYGSEPMSCSIPGP